jgi:hypothetical protein
MIDAVQESGCDVDAGVFRKVERLLQDLTGA